MKTECLCHCHRSAHKANPADHYNDVCEVQTCSHCKKEEKPKEILGFPVKVQEGLAPNEAYLSNGKQAVRLWQIQTMKTECKACKHLAHPPVKRVWSDVLEGKPAVECDCKLRAPDYKHTCKPEETPKECDCPPKVKERGGLYHLTTCASIFILNPSKPKQDVGKCTDTRCFTNTPHNRTPGCPVPCKPEPSAVTEKGTKGENCRHEWYDHPYKFLCKKCYWSKPSPDPKPDKPLEEDFPREEHFKKLLGLHAILPGKNLFYVDNIKPFISDLLKDHVCAYNDPPQVCECYREALSSERERLRKEIEKLKLDPYKMKAEIDKEPDLYHNKAHGHDVALHCFPHNHAIDEVLALIKPPLP